MKKCTISKDGRVVFVCAADFRIEALKKYCKELGPEALDYYAVNPDWLYDLVITFEEVPS